MADIIQCNQGPVTWFKWRRRIRWHFLYLSDDDRNENNSVLATIRQQNMQDLQNRFDAARCDNSACLKTRSDFRVANPVQDNSYIRCSRKYYTLWIGIRCVVYNRIAVDVRCDLQG